MIKEINDIQRYEALKKQIDELNLSITNACATFVERYYPSATFIEWKFNDKKTLIVITYVAADKYNGDNSYKIYTSFDEIQHIIDENLVFDMHDFESRFETDIEKVSEMLNKNIGYE